MLKNLKTLFHRRKADADINDELRFHLEKEIELNIARAMSAEEARRRALIAFGGLQQTRERVREAHWTHFAEILTQDLRYTWRMLRKTPGFTLVAVLTLALGIGMNTAIFSLIDDVLFHALPGRHPDELVVLRWRAHTAPELDYSSDGYCVEKFQARDASSCSLPFSFFQAARDLPDVFSGLAASTSPPGQLTLSIDGPAEAVGEAQLVSAEFFQTLGIGAAVGRTLGPADDSPSASPALMISYSYWRNQFGGDPSVIGRTVRLNGIPFAIVGVAERGFSGLRPGRGIELWLPLSLRNRLVSNEDASQAKTDPWCLLLVGRRKPGVPVTQAQAAASLLFRNQSLHGDKPVFKADDDPTINLVPAQHALREPRESSLPPLYVLMMAAGLVLLVACANITGLLLARAAAREKEMAIRLTLGARRGRLVRQMLTESLTLSLLGGAIGLVIAQWGARLLNVLSVPSQRTLQFAPQIDVRVLGFTVTIAIVTGIVFGLAPALRLHHDLTPALNASASGVFSVGSRRTRFSLGNGLVVAQVALAMVALVCAGKLIHTLANLRNIDPGFDTRNVLVFGIDGGGAGYDQTRVDALYRDLREKFAAVPGVISASYSGNSLLSGLLWMGNVHLPGKPELQLELTDTFFTGPGFFSTMRMPLQMGRDFTDADFAIAHADAAASRSMSAGRNAGALTPIPVIVNETLVRRFFPQQNPLGRYLEVPPPRDPAERRGPGWQIIGVVRDAKYNELRRDINPTMYIPISGRSAIFELRTVADPLQLVPAMRQVANQTDRNLALFDIATQSAQVDNVLFQERRIAQLSSFFGLLALALACTGIYGLLSYEVTRRTREIGIRMAIGAQRTDIVAMVLRKGLWMTLVGAAVGIGGSFATTRVLRAILYQVTPSDPWTLVAVAVLLLLVALLACCLPARRATRVDPLVALRYE